MVIPKINSAHGSDTRNIINRAIDSINVQGKSIQDLVANGQLTPSEYATLIKTVEGLIAKGQVSVYDLNLNLGKITENMLDDSLKKIITGDAPISPVLADKSITSDKLADDSVGFSAANFFSRSEKNLFNGDYSNGWLAATYYNGIRSLVTRKNNSQNNGRTAVIKVDPNTQYYLEVVDKDIIGSVSVALTSKYPQFEDENKIENSTVDIIVDNQLNRSLSFTTKSDTSYVLVAVSREGKEPRLQLEKGNVFTNYEPGSYIDSSMIAGEKYTPLSTGKNKFDGFFRDDIYVGVSPIVDKTVNQAQTAVIPIERGKQYHFKKYEGGNRLRISIVDKYPKENNLPLDSLYHNVIDNNGAEYEFTFVNNYGENDINYMVVYTNSVDLETPLIQVEEGDKATEYEEYYLKFLEKRLHFNAMDTKGFPSKNYYIYDDITGVYNSPELPSVAARESFDLRQSQHSDIYDIYNDFVNENTNYINKSELGKDLLGNPINLYHFNPASISSNVTLDKPKLILTSGVHGNEKLAVWSLVQFLKDMIYNWEGNSILEFIRWNFEILVVPMCNPSGYDLDTRKNHNGVDLNRNFKTDNWRKMNDSESVNYGGDSAGSEKETQIISEFLRKHRDAECVVDFHNYFQHDGFVMWMPTNDIALKRIGTNVMSLLTRKWKKEYNHFPQSDDVFFGFTNSVYAPTLRHYADSIGIKATTVESVHQITYGAPSSRYDEISVRCAVEWAGNYLAGISKNIK